MKYIALALMAFSSATFANLSLLKIGQAPLGHCTGFFDHSTDSLYTAAHCIKNSDMPILNQNGDQIDLISRDDISFFVEMLGVTDMASLKAPQALAYEKVQIVDMDEVSNLSSYVILGYPEMNREGAEVTYLKCERIYPQSAFDSRSIEVALGTVHLTCPQYIYKGKEYSTDDLLHRHIRGMSGGPVLSEGKIVGVAYHFNERDGSYKVQTRLPETRQASYHQVWRPYQLDRRLFEEIKVPNNVNLQIDMWLFSMGKPTQLRNEILEVESNGAELLLRTNEDILSFDLLTLPVSLRRMIETQRYPQ